MEVNTSPKPEILVKLESLNVLCRICFGNATVRPFFKANIEEGLGVYCEMILQCFNIQITPEMNNLNGNNICESCISRLQDACKFKMLIENSQRIFQNQLNSNGLPIELSQPDKASSIDESHIDVKSEQSDDNTFDNLDLDYLDEVSVKKSSVVKKSKKPKAKRKIQTPKNETKGKTAAEIEWEEVSKKYNSDKNITKCETCGVEFLSHQKLLHHLNDHYQNFICDQCGKYFASQRRVFFHRKMHETFKQEVCPICNKTYKNLVSFKAHMRVTHKSKQSFKCFKCDEVLTSDYRRVKHMVDKHGVDPSRYKCTSCPKAYLTGQKLRRHIRRDHLYERNFSCEVCGKTFFAKNTLREHMMAHSSVRSHHCTLCPASYKSIFILRKHIRNKHQSESTENNQQ